MAASQENSLLDHLTEGLVSCLLTKSTPSNEPFLSSLVSSPTGTRLFEAILQWSPQPVYRHIWTLYFEGKIGKLAGHPFANFVVAKGVGRLDREGIQGVVRECKAVSGGRGLISMSFHTSGNADADNHRKRQD